MMTDPFKLQRFVDAQASVYGRVLDELRAGRKETHWMWFVFPQLKELGRSPMAQRYGISSRDEALAYIDHPVLGQRLVECTRLLLAVNGKTALQIMGSPDDLKLRSCWTLFQLAKPEWPIWDQALAKYFAGQPDPRTQALM